MNITEQSERFNFLDWEANHGGEGAGFTMNIVALLDEIAGAIAGGAGKAEGGGDNKFFEDGLHHMNMNLVDLPLFAKIPVSLPLLRSIVITAPQSLAEARSDEWKHGPGECAEILRVADEMTRDGDPEVRADFEECRAYWLQEFAGLSEKTRSIITLSFSMLVRPFVTRPLRQLFSADTTLTPEATFDGKIIIVDLPVQDLKLAGRVAQMVWKYCFQVAVLRRQQPPPAPKGREEEQEYLRPVFLWWDEGQNFLTPFDVVWHAVARSAGGCSVMLVQTREALRDVMGKNDAVDALLANLQVKFFCQSSSIDTNDFASKLIGERWVERETVSTTGTATVTKMKERYVEPGDFTTLYRGGPKYGHLVQAIVYHGGFMFTLRDKDGKTAQAPAAPLTFHQRK